MQMQCRSCGGGCCTEGRSNLAIAFSVSDKLSFVLALLVLPHFCYFNPQSKLPVFFALVQLHQKCNSNKHRSAASTGVLLHEDHTAICTLSAGACSCVRARVRLSGSPLPPWATVTPSPPTSSDHCLLHASGHTHPGVICKVFLHLCLPLAVVPCPLLPAPACLHNLFQVASQAGQQLIRTHCQHVARFTAGLTARQEQGDWKAMVGTYQTNLELGAPHELMNTA